MIRIGINGFGRIGRMVLRIALSDPKVTIVAINDIKPVDYIAYSLKYDSVHGKYRGDIHVDGDELIVNGERIVTFSKDNPENISWSDFDVDYVIEATGRFTSHDLAQKHRYSGAKNVVISAPSDDVPMFVYGVNHTELKSDMYIFSNASCTTNCLAPLCKVLDESFGIEEALVTTVHCTTSSQNTVDGAASNYRRGRSALNNMIPTTTSAGKAISRILPKLEGKINAMAVRVPIVDVSLIDMTVRVSKSTSYNEIMKTMLHYSENELKGIMGYTEDHVVSQDFVSDPRTSIVDASAGMELNDRFFKIVSWYDNEYGYASKLIEMIKFKETLNPS